MFLNPKKAIDAGWLKVNAENIQPNAVDIPINKIYSLKKDNAFWLFKNKKIHKTRSELPLLSKSVVKYWELSPGAYDFFSNAYVKMPEGVCGWLITRSTLNRNGIIVHSGLYDSGYEGHINGSLYVFHEGENFIEEGSCVAQFLMASSHSVGLYAGGYNTAEGDIPDQLKNHIK